MDEIGRKGWKYSLPFPSIIFVLENDIFKHDSNNGKIRVDHPA
jgi:hypothetical protein